MFHCDIDTSSSFMGMTRNAQVGMWTLLLPLNAGCDEARTHLLRVGEEAAVQFRIASGTRRLRQTVTLSCATIDQRERLLQQLAGSAARHAA